MVALSKEKLLASAAKNLEKGQVGKAIKDYQQIIEADPKDIRNRQKLAELFSRERMRDEALKEYEAVGKTYSDTGFYLKAIAVYRQMQRLDSSRPEIYRRLAELSEKQGLTGDALSEYRHLSAIYEKSRKFSEQLKILQKIRELDPDNLNVRVKIIDNTLLVDSAENARKELQELLDSLAISNDHARALKLYDFYLPKFPSDLQLLAGQAEFLIRKGEKDRGMQTLQNLLRKSPDNADILRILARVHRHEGKYQEERLIYERLLVGHPEDLDLREAYLRAGIEAGETVSVRNELDKWQQAFNDAGRNEQVQALQSRLNGVSPELESSNRFEMPSADMIAPKPGGKNTELIQDAPMEPVEDLEEIAEMLEEVEEPAEEELVLQMTGIPEAEEVSLDFLEESPLDFIEASAPAEVPDVQPAAEMELAEVELDLELDMELELDSFDVEPGEKIMEAVAGDEEDDSLEFDLAEEVSPEAAIDLMAEMEEFVDLSSEIAEEMDNPIPAPASETITAVPAKKRVKTGVEVEDPETHFNLGIAYKEMGLLDDAIGEFDKAMRAPARAASCLILKGMCLLEKGERKKAEETLKTGLAGTGFSEEDRISLHFELGEIYEGGNQFSEALDCFKYVAERDRFHRNASERVDVLRQRLGLENDDNDAGAAKAGGRKNRVSYV